MSDSPIWKRGKRSRSQRTTLQPCWARSVAQVLPAGPPPMTRTSGDCVTDEGMGFSEFAFPLLIYRLDNSCPNNYRGRFSFRFAHALSREWALAIVRNP